MIFNRNNYKLYSIFFILLILLNSCEKFKGDQTIPSYIQIDTLYLIDNPLLEEGSLSHNITDVWIYVDDQIIGAFELPALFPVLHQGKHKLTISAGIKLNGIAATRVPYPFYKPIIIGDFDFVIDSIIKIDTSTMYYDNTDFPWKENFEDAFITLETTTKSDTTLEIKYHDPNDEVLGHKSGLVYLDDVKIIFECATNVGEDEGFVLPGGGASVFLELNYKTNNEVVIGLFINSYSQVIQQPVLNLNPSNGLWKKIYVNFTSIVSSSTNAIDFNVFLGAVKQYDVANPEILFDNIKLIHAN